MDSGKVPAKALAHADGLDPDEADRPLFATTIRPHQSLGRAGFRVMMALFGGLSFVVSLTFVRMGFWPVAGFFGLDVLALYLALKTSFRRGRSFEEVVVTRLEVLLARVTHRGKRAEWRFNPLWTRLHKRVDDEFGLQALALTSRGQRVAVARDASPAVRERVADGLTRALTEAKRGF
jgi:uncharacterized membrane protein